MSVVDVETGTILYQQVCSADGVWIHNRWLVVAAQVKAAAVTQWRLRCVVPADAPRQALLLLVRES